MEAQHPSQRRPARPALAALVLAGLVWAAGCGKKGPPLPPLRSYPERVAHASIRQIGDHLVVSFPRPTARTDGAPLGPDASVEILMTARDPAPKHAGEIELNPDVTWNVRRAEWDAYTQGRRMEVGIGLARIASSLELPSGPSGLKGRRLTFIVQVVEEKNKRSLPSDVETFTVCEPPPAPANTAARIVEEGLLLTWSGTGTKVSVYRQEEGGVRPETPIDPAPLESSTYLDAAALPGKTYWYLVRAKGATERCESADSPVAEATRVDLFPPGPPQGLAAVAEKTGERTAIRLFWRPNREPDLHGYRVYRAGGATGAFRLLTPEDLTATSYTDEDVTPGVVYSYAVTARDGATPPNESLFSDPAIEKTEPGE